MNKDKLSSAALSLFMCNKTMPVCFCVSAKLKSKFNVLSLNTENNIVSYLLGNKAQFHLNRANINSTLLYSNEKKVCFYEIYYYSPIGLNANGSEVSSVNSRGMIFFVCSYGSMF